MKHPKLVTLSLAAAVLATLAGCSAGPTAPLVPAAGPSDPGANLKRTDSGNGTSAPQTVDSQGGVLTLGRFTVSVPAGAVRGPVEVSLVQLDAGGLSVTLSAFPAVEQFSRPIVLTADCSGLFNPGRMKHTYLSQPIPGTSGWQRLVDSSVDPATGLVTASTSVCTTVRIENRSIRK